MTGKKIYFIIFASVILNMAFFCNTFSQQNVEKTNPMKVYMHYMPWFETPASIGRWGWHWTMNNQNPDIIIDGKRQIASHYYPLIGPYASRDKDVIEYHMLLMKLSGVDGILINWYGIAGSNSDINDLLKSSDTIISLTDDFGLQFGVCMEDRFSRSINDVKANMTYLKNNYFQKPEYIRYGTAMDPLVFIFGPITFQSPSDWTEIMPSAGEDIEFLTLWYESDEAGNNADGEFMWVFQDETNHLTHLSNYYQNRAPLMKTVAGVAYPGFKDFYAEGNAGSTFFSIPHYYGSTLGETFNRIDQYKDDLDMVQLVTFNDFGEGTMFEPTLETGFDYLKKLQTYTGVQYGLTELQLVHRLYVLRKEFASDEEVQSQLDQVSIHLRNLEIDAATEILNLIDTNVDENTGSIHSPHIFPNPWTAGDLKIEFSKSLNYTQSLSIVDQQGKYIYEANLESGITNHIIPQLNLTSGIYYVIIRSEKGDYSAKLVVE